MTCSPLSSRSDRSRSNRTVPALRATSLVLLAAAMLVESGCVHYRSRPLGQQGLCGDLPAVPVGQVPPQYLGRPKSDLVEISFTRLRQTPPEVYQLAEGDVLGVYIRNVLEGSDEAPPVNFPEDPSQPPSIGFPIPIREDGTVALPLVRPVEVAGLTVPQATEAIRRAYTVDSEILATEDGEDQGFIVTLMRRRQHRVLVIREEAGDVQGNRSRRGGGNNANGPVKHGSGYNVDLPMYENDLLHALNETGGLPGLDAENYVLIYKGGNDGSVHYDEMVARLKGMRQPCMCGPEIPPDPNVIFIPIRFYPDQLPTFTERDIILEDGDIVYVPSRDNEKFYTGGELDGGEHLIPRDYDINVMQAIAIAGGDVGGNQALSNFGGRRGGAGGGIIPPTRIIVLRQIPCVGEIPIEIDVREALANPRSRILIQPGDTILLRYTRCQGISNALLNLFQVNLLLGNGLR